MTALFRSAHQAILFAWTFSSTQHGTAAAAERQIALQARERYERMAGAGRGLRGLDGAAQAGMIRSLIERNTPRPFSLVCVARFAVLDPAARRAAATILALRARRSLPDSVPVWASVELVMGATGSRINLPHIADRADVHVRTVRNWRLSVRKFIEPIEIPGMHTAEVLLEDAGIVEVANAPHVSPDSIPG